MAALSETSSGVQTVSHSDASRAKVGLTAVAVCKFRDMETKGAGVIKDVFAAGLCYDAEAVDEVMAKLPSTENMLNGIVARTKKVVCRSIRGIMVWPGLLFLLVCFHCCSGAPTQQPTIASAVSDYSVPYTGGNQNLLVPAGFSGSLLVSMCGAVGGNGGGFGGFVQAVVPLVAGETIYFVVGGRGDSGTASAGGFNGGGAGSAAKSGGGGASDVRLEDGVTRLVIAGGGGGNSGGGAGGGLIAQSGQSTTAGANGGGGSHTIGGAGGPLKCSLFPGTQYQGGSGCGGGGGGGFYGGGAGSKAGGGGSSYAISSSVRVVTMLINIQGDPRCNSEGSIFFQQLSPTSLPQSYYPTSASPNGFALTAGNLIGSVSLPDNYIVSFDVFPTIFKTGTGLQSILHLTGNGQANNSPGSRLPNVEFCDGSSSCPLGALGVSYCGTSTQAWMGTTQSLPLSVWSFVKVTVSLDSLLLSLTVTGGVSISTQSVSIPSPSQTTWPFVQVLASDPWTVAASANIRNIAITVRPSSAPTVYPTLNPSPRITLSPSASPSSPPTASATALPSAKPSSTPTQTPTAAITKSPSVVPTIKSTPSPSPLPSASPSAIPSPVPTSTPTFTALPSASPTTTATVSPSVKPSPLPTRLPTSMLTQAPSVAPTVVPSCAPTFQNPTQAPSARPTQPTPVPSMPPSPKPSPKPTQVPSPSPTLQPVLQPSAVPTRLPTGQPTRQPSSQPSRQPFSHPSRQPSGQPTRKPSGQPTRQPSSQPSAQPNRRPTGQPSRIPSSRPSAQPASHPTGQPTSQPTLGICQRGHFLVLGGKSHNSNGTSLVKLSCTPCPRGKYSNTLDAESCKPCPVGTFNSQTGMTGCKQVLAGTFGALSGLSAGSLCNSGSYTATPGATECSFCRAGEYSVTGASVCLPCPLNSFNPSTGAGVCIKCPQAKLTPIPGATSIISCVSPVNNFALGYVALVLSGLVAGVYIVAGRYRFAAFLRSHRVVGLQRTQFTAFGRGISKKEKDYLRTMEEEKFRDKIWEKIEEKQKNFKEEEAAGGVAVKKSNLDMEAIAKRAYPFMVLAKDVSVTLLFIVISIFVSIFCFTIVFCAIITSIFFQSLIIYRSSSAYQLFDYKAITREIIDAILSLFKDIPGIPNFLLRFVEYLLSAMVICFDWLNFFKVDLTGLGVTCTGASAPFQLLLDILVFGGVLLIIQSDTMLFSRLSLKSTLNKYTGYLLTREYRMERVSERFKDLRLRIIESSTDESPRDINEVKLSFLVQFREVSLFFFEYVGQIIFILSCQVFAFVANFQNVLQYALSLVQTSVFASDNHLHKFSDTCDSVPGYENYDRILAYASSFLAFWLMAPVTYEIAKTLTPLEPATGKDRDARPFCMGRLQTPESLKQRLQRLGLSESRQSEVSPDFDKQVVFKANRDSTKKIINSSSLGLNQKFEKVFEKYQMLSFSATTLMTWGRFVVTIFSPDVLAQHIFLGMLSALRQTIILKKERDEEEKSAGRAPSQKVAVLQEDGVGLALNEEAKRVNDDAIVSVSEPTSDFRPPVKSTRFVPVREKLLENLNATTNKKCCTYLSIFVTRIYIALANLMVALGGSCLEFFKTVLDAVRPFDNSDTSKEAKRWNEDIQSSRLPSFLELLEIEAFSLSQGIAQLLTICLSREVKPLSFLDPEAAPDISAAISSQSWRSVLYCCSVLALRYFCYLFLFVVPIGHLFTPEGRYCWALVFRKFITFFCCALGYWDAHATEAFCLDKKVKETADDKKVKEEETADGSDETSSPMHPSAGTRQSLTTSKTPFQEQPPPPPSLTPDETGAIVNAQDDGDQQAARDALTTPFTQLKQYLSTLTPSKIKARFVHTPKSSAETDQKGREEEDDTELYEKYSSCISATIAPRCVLLQVFPYCSPISVFLIAISASPMFVRADKESSGLHLKLNPYIISNPIVRATRQEGESKYMFRGWMMSLQAVSIFILDSRAFSFLFSSYIFFVAVWILLFPVTYSLVVSLVVIVGAVSLAYTLKVVVLIGKTMNVKGLVTIFCRTQNLSEGQSDKIVEEVLRERFKGRGARELYVQASKEVSIELAKRCIKQKADAAAEQVKKVRETRQSSLFQGITDRITRGMASFTTRRPIGSVTSVDSSDGYGRPSERLRYSNQGFQERDGALNPSPTDTIPRRITALDEDSIELVRSEQIKILFEPTRVSKALYGQNAKKRALGSIVKPDETTKKDEVASTSEISTSETGENVNEARL